MVRLLWLIPALPLLSFLLLAVRGSRLPRKAVAYMGVGSTGISALITLAVGASFLASPPSGHAYVQTLWTWVDVAGFSPRIALYLDALSLVMMVVITGVGFLIHLYSVEYMREDEGYGRFFAYMNLFVASMLILVLADNLVLLYVGWECVGACSYLLIGFWYRESANGAAAIKAFVMTRLGDIGLLIGIFVLFTAMGTFNIADIARRAVEIWPAGSSPAFWAALLLLIGALGKSAQLPLQTWLPDAMAGPTPVSALIHAATMVTAGVYLIARTHDLFLLAPDVLSAVAVIGLATALVAGCSALVQSDIKRVLAYSTISQIGYMFLALGLGAWSAAMFHFLTHAFFKALLFLAAGSVIMAAHHEQDMFKLGGLRRELPVTFWTFVVGSAVLASVPLITAGFYSKDAILWYAYSSELGGPWLWAGGILGAFLTGLYAFRAVCLTFLGSCKTAVTQRMGPAATVPLVVLAVFSLVIGFIELPPTIADVRWFSSFMSTCLPNVKTGLVSHSTEVRLQIVCAV
ncbi:MAG: NADH-quinone oxidoreductase subunit L, partial [Pseudomonadota bacterium]